MHRRLRHLSADIGDREDQPGEKDADRVQAAKERNAQLIARTRWLTAGIGGLMALIGAAPEFGGPGFLLPTRNHEIFAWCLEAGLQLVYQMTLMTTGFYEEPDGAYLPSVLF